MAGREGATTSVKSVGRALELLKLLGAGTAEGWRLSDLAGQAGLGKATTHRLLGALQQAGFAYQSPEDRRYRLGADAIRLGGATVHFDVVELLRPALIRLAKETGDTVFLSVREGLDAVCLDRQEGDYPIKTLTLKAGDRRPLGVGAGSLALLAALPDQEVEAVVAANGDRLAAYPNFAPDALRALIARSRDTGYAFNDGRIVSAMSAIGVPCRDGAGRLVAALSAAAINERMSAERVAWLASRLQAEAAGIAELTSHRGGS